MIMSAISRQFKAATEVAKTKRAEAKVSARIFTLEFESALQRIWQSAGIVLPLAGSIAVRIRNRLTIDPLAGTGRNPPNGSGQRDPCASAAQSRLCENRANDFPAGRRRSPALDLLRKTKHQQEETMNDIIIFICIAAMITLAALPWLWKFRHVFCVPEGWAGLVYHYGLYIRRSNGGRHVLWGRGWTMNLIDLRKTSLLVAGQEVLTADSVNPKISLLVTYQVTDPVKAAHETQSWQSELYNAVQLALRAVISSIPVEALLNQRLEIGAQLLARVQAPALGIGVSVLAVEVKDAMFPAELKRAFAEVLKAKHEGQAALERARGETAALRHLANAARVLEDNPALMNLRLMQSLGAAQNGGSTLVLGVPGGFVPLKQQTRNVAPEGHEAK
jgi:regulator of protease activity HflC (stomatin/prohibitin superfamily)